MHSIFLIHYLINTYGKILVLLRKTGGKKIITSSGIIDGKTYKMERHIIEEKINVLAMFKLNFLLLLEVL